MIFRPSSEWWALHRVRTLALERGQHPCALCPAEKELEVHHRNYAYRGFEQIGGRDRPLFARAISDTTAHSD